MVRVYARIVAVALLALALTGFSGLLKIDSLDNFYHAGLGVIFLYVGFLERDRDSVRLEVGGLGVVTLVSKSLMLLVLLLVFGYLEHGPTAVACYVVGISSLLAAKYLPDS